MQKKEKNQYFCPGGSITAMVTPFVDGDETKIDYRAFEALMEYQITMGTDAILVLGTTGESAALSDGERRDVIRFALKQKYRDREPLLRKEIPHDSMGLRLESEETKLLRAGGVPYVYDIEITMEDGTVDTFIDRGKLIVTEEVD